LIVRHRSNSLALYVSSPHSGHLEIRASLIEILTPSNNRSSFGSTISCNVALLQAGHLMRAII
jgi:hypothetical protein